MLNRFLTSKLEKEGGGRGKKRPYLASECRDLNECDRWRGEILRDIGKKVMEIQNAGLGEHRLRDLNDEINKLIREKWHWEKRIVALGGPNYARAAPRVADGEDGLSVPGGRQGSYRYFGAAKTLPGVRELFEKPAPRVVRRTRQQLQQSIDADYYGFRDEEDGVLLRAEAAAEKLLLAEARQRWEAEQAEREAAGGAAARGAAEDAESAFMAHVPLPDRGSIEAAVVAKKKRELLAKYQTSEQTRAEDSTRALMSSGQRTGQ
jgi:pre-mRNA-splicing factor ISY1